MGSVMRPGPTSRTTASARCSTTSPLIWPPPFRKTESAWARDGERASSEMTAMRFMTASQITIGLPGGEINCSGAPAIESAPMRARAAVIAGWATAAVALAVAAGGAASGPDGWLLGLPSLPLALAAVVALTGLALLVGPGGGRWLWPVAPVLLLVVGGLAAGRVQVRVGPQADEPHCLMVADSLIRDHDLSLERDYAEGRYRDFHPAPLAPHYRVRGKGGEIYSLHAVGLSLIVLPAYAVASYAGASFLMALLGVWLAWELRALLRAL